MLLTILAVLVAPVLAGVLVVVAGVTLNQDWLSSVGVPLGTVVAVSGVWLALVRRGWSRRDLGFVRGHRSSWHLLWEVPLLWIGALVGAVVVGTLAGITPSNSDADVSRSADALELGVGALALTAVCVTIVAPALEEVLFRRILLGWIEQRAGLLLAVIGSALAFGLVHLSPPIILLQILVGLGAATLVRAHRTLWASLALHGLNNGVVTVVATLAVLG